MVLDGRLEGRWTIAQPSLDPFAAAAIARSRAALRFIGIMAHLSAIFARLGAKNPMHFFVECRKKTLPTARATGILRRLLVAIGGDAINAIVAISIIDLSRIARCDFALRLNWLCYDLMHF